jgi:hypothetical protein
VIDAVEHGKLRLRQQAGDLFALRQRRDAVFLAPDEERRLFEAAVIFRFEGARAFLVAEQAGDEPVGDRVAGALDVKRAAIDRDPLGCATASSSATKSRRPLPIINGLVKVAAMIASRRPGAEKSGASGGLAGGRPRPSATSSKTRPEMRSGWVSAASTVAPPPKEWPSSTNCLSRAASAKARMRRACA